MEKIEDLEGFKELQAIALKAKKALDRNNINKTKAPRIDCNFAGLICGAVFKLSKQTDRALVLKGDKDLTKLRGHDLDQVGRYIVATKETVEIKGWDFKIIRYRRGSLFLRPIAPTDM